MPRGCHGNHARADKQHRWNDRKMIASNGYVKIRVGRRHPLADPNGYAYEHLVVWCAAGNARPARGLLLHHRNEVKTDNRIENLDLVARGHHNAHHVAKRRRDPTTGRLLDGREHNGMPEAAP